MKNYEAILRELDATADSGKAVQLARFFKTGPGEYGEGDRFLGITVPVQRAVAKKYRDTDFESLHRLLSSPWHEHRLTALLITVFKFESSRTEEEKKACIDFYISHTDYINNWDLVDLSCYKLLGKWMEGKDRSLLYQWACSSHLWRQRISIVTCMHFVRQGDFTDCLSIADILLRHPHDLIHKAVGWLLRETGKKDEKVLIDFLQTRYRIMPRTMLRYAIERFPEKTRKNYLRNSI